MDSDKNDVLAHDSTLRNQRAKQIRDLLGPGSKKSGQVAYKTLQHVVTAPSQLPFAKRLLHLVVPRFDGPAKDLATF